MAFILDEGTGKNVDDENAAWNRIQKFGYACTHKQVIVVL